ncbi:hypothetical protein PGT21_035778 [Puccinia graminis f. sp. tritici]|uniref:Uncharacterized protein n=1 Tax=Puccinia graminis f. sp. tritici TaxID=56615 RepID=A0A5B0QCR5_PUCGR|nr:hypothetical protein PGT21_035778 [Puccinia graminis f. sp. tritici]
MQLASVLSAFHLLHYYVISAHPILYPKHLQEREVKGASVDNQLKSLYKRMEGSSQGGRMTDDEIVAQMKEATRPYMKMLDFVARKEEELKIRSTESDKNLKHQYDNFDPRVVDEDSKDIKHLDLHFVKK